MISSPAALLRQSRKGGLFFHISPVTSSRRPSSLANRFPSLSNTKPPTPRKASAAKNLILASGSSGFTKPVGCTCTHSRSIDLAPTASPILMPSPVQCSPLVVGRWSKSGRYLASNESDEKSAPKPPLQRMTHPNSFATSPPFSYLQPTTMELLQKSSVTFALVTIRALSLISAIFSKD